MKTAQHNTLFAVLLAGLIVASASSLALAESAALVTTTDQGVSMTEVELNTALPSAKVDSSGTVVASPAGMRVEGAVTQTTTSVEPALVTTVSSSGKVSKEAALVAKTTTVTTPVAKQQVVLPTQKVVEVTKVERPVVVASGGLASSSLEEYNSVYKTMPDYYWSGSRWVYLPSN